MSRLLSQPAMNDLLAMLEHYESLHDGKLIPNRITPQMDPLGIWTEGYGQEVLVNGQPIKGFENRSNALANAKFTTKEQALTGLGVRLQSTVDALEQLSTGKLTDFELAALTDFSYNIGLGGFESSTIYKLIKAGTSNLITFANFKSWDEGVDQSGKKEELDGLIARRASEWVMFKGGGFQVYNCDKGVLTPNLNV